MCNTWDKVFFLWYMCEGTLHVRDTCEILLFPAKSFDICKTENLYFFVQAFSALVKECLLCSPLHLWQQQHTWHWHTLVFLHQCFLLQNVLLEESKKDKPIQCITRAAMPRLDIHSFITYHVRYCTAKVINQRTPILLIWAGTLRREGWVWWRESTGSQNKGQAGGCNKPWTKERFPTYELGNIVSSCPLHVWRPRIFHTSGYYPTIRGVSPQKWLTLNGETAHQQISSHRFIEVTTHWKKCARIVGTNKVNQCFCTRRSMR